VAQSNIAAVKQQKHTSGQHVPISVIIRKQFIVVVTVFNLCAV